MSRGRRYIYLGSLGLTPCECRGEEEYLFRSLGLAPGECRGERYFSSPAQGAALPKDVCFGNILAGFKPGRAKIVPRHPQGAFQGEDIFVEATFAGR